MMEYTDARTVARMFAALGEPTRLKIVAALLAGPHNVGELAKFAGIPMVNMSHHLGVMRQAGVVEDEKRGRTVVYRLREDVFTPGTNGSLGTLAFGSFRVVIVAAPSARAKRKSAAE